MWPSGLLRVLIVFACLAVASPGFAVATSSHVPNGSASVPGLSPTSAPTTTQPFFPKIRVTDGTSGFTDQVEPTMAVNRSGTIFVGWKEIHGATAAAVRGRESYPT